MNLKQKAGAIAASAQQVAAFVATVSDKIPDEYQDQINIEVAANSASLSINIQHEEEATRYAILGYLGEAFGRQGWTADPDYYKDWFTWTKTIETITITIRGAEKCPETSKGIPVPANKFPLMLESYKDKPSRAVHDESLFESDINSF